MDLTDRHIQPSGNNLQGRRSGRLIIQILCHFLWHELVQLTSITRTTVFALPQNDCTALSFGSGESTAKRRNSSGPGRSMQGWTTSG